MSILKAYLFRHKGALALAAIAVIVYPVVAYLYGLPGEPVLYTLLLTGAGGAVFFVIGIEKYASRCREVELLLPGTEENSPALPTPYDRLEQDYQQLLRSACASRAQLASAEESQRRDMMDYYTLWAHQIKTPIAAMHLLLQEPGEDTAEELSGELFKTEQYVEMVLSYLRLGGKENDFVLRRQPLDDILHGAVRKFARIFILKKITLHYTETGLTVLTDAKWMSFLVEQILSNSLKYTPQGGTITMYAEDSILYISDSGIGICAEDLPRVFEKGFTGYNGHEDKKASGLGLYLCSETAKKLNISITASSEVGHGTTMRIGLCTKTPEYE
jgi:signal transduction histidine kinase